MLVVGLPVAVLAAQLLGVVLWLNSERLYPSSCSERCRGNATAHLVAQECARRPHRPGAAMPASPAITRLRIDVWADVVCPWCYVGAARLRTAIADAGLSDAVDLVPRAFELDPTTPASPRPILERLAHKFGGLLAGSSAMLERVRAMEERVRDLAVAEGLPYSVDRMTANTHDAHRVTALSARHGLGMAYFDALQRAYFAGAGQDPFGRAALLAVADEVGLPTADVERVLDSDELADQVRRDQEEALALGVPGVPFVVVAGRYSVSGAREVVVYRQALAAGLAQHD
jgi:predicted DsbA family dithiol-disulfide isomerase